LMARPGKNSNILILSHFLIILWLPILQGKQIQNK